MTVAYDGRAFLGSQRQGDARTVQAELERAVEEVFGQTIPVYLAGRTDRGVHAAGQVASFALNKQRPGVDQIATAINMKLDWDISVLRAERKPVGFHARHSATKREYRYRIWSGVRNPLCDGFVWTIRSPLDLVEMRRAAEVLKGQHDYASFSSGGTGVPWARERAEAKSTVRTVQTIDITEQPNWWGVSEEEGKLLEVKIEANGFLPRMVRGIVGSLVGVGRGSLTVAEVQKMLDASDRRKGPENAPPGGLILWRVEYDSEQERSHERFEYSGAE